MKINVKLPYEGAAQYYKVWATTENDVDFYGDLPAATKCTTSYAAYEIVTYLKKLGFEAEVGMSEYDFEVALICDEKECEEFEISAIEKGIEIHGFGRAGVLYGAYEFLEAQGIRWYTIDREYVPEGKTEITIPELKKYVYAFPIGRGFAFEGPLKESPELFIWMARNRFSKSGVRPHTIKLQRKLALRPKAGGHIFEAILDPHNFTEDGRTFLEAYPHWYGKRDCEITYDNAQSVQFCVNEPDLLDFLAEKFLEKVKTEWKDADIIDVWNFDTWGGSCNCEKCKATGNSMDRALKLIAHLRKRVNEAYDRGELVKKYNVITDLYEGGDTIDPALNPIPEGIAEDGFFASFAPILRCYKHGMDDKSCDINRFYSDRMEKVKGFPLSINEYYNVSKFEDLPYVFTNSIINDVRYYHELGAKGFTYMHLPMVEWGVKTLTQHLLANLLRDPYCDIQTKIDEYFEHIYGKYADKARKAYELCEEGTLYSSSWRSWDEKSILSTLIGWNGYTVDEPLFRDSHLGDTLNEKAYRAAECFKEALDIMRELRADAHASIKLDVPAVIARGVNPSQHQKFKTIIPIFDRLNEDIRGLKYGADCARLLALFIEYYELLHKKEDETKIWNEIYELANNMSDYSYAVKYRHPVPKIMVVDALDRSGMKELFARVLSARNQNLNK